MTTTTLPAVPKTDLMLLIEARDPQRRDVREIVKALYDQHRRLESVAEELTHMAGRKVTLAAVHSWITSEWGWSLERVLVIPEAEEATR